MTADLTIRYDWVSSQAIVSRQTKKPPLAEEIVPWV